MKHCKDVRCCDVLIKKYFRLNEAENSLRCLSFFFVLFSPPEEFLDVFAPVVAYVVFICSTALKLSFTSAGIIQLILLLNSDSYSILEFLGIDSDAIWKLRVFHTTIALLGAVSLLTINSFPIFYYRLIRIVAVPDNTWIVSISFNTVVFVSFNLIVFVQMCKIYNNWKIIRMVNEIIAA
jgi:hypothetical protein